MIDFVGVDGEGGDIIDPDGFTTHQYTMLRAGDAYTTGPDWLGFLISLPKKKTYVAFAFDYDVTMMLRDMEPARVAWLMQHGEVEWNGYRIGYRPHKEFWVSRYGKRTTINDVFTFFQSSFVTALERWGIGTRFGRLRIKATKLDRSGFGELTPETIEYNHEEVRYLRELMRRFYSACVAIGYLPRRWQGPGQLAKAMYRHHGIPRTVDLPAWPVGLAEHAQAAYYGGRFETSCAGPVRHPIDAWDINSAYPFACTRLPCLQHSTWVPWRGGDIVEHGLYEITYNHGRNSRWYTLPHRTKTGNIRFPRAGAGWYWGAEIRAGRVLALDAVVLRGWECVRQCACTPFDFMGRLYAVRKAIGKTTAGMALKLAMNSAYGITAQSIGKPEYSNPIWAGLITAMTRATLLEALAPNPDAVLMLATDGLFCYRGALDLTPSAELGGWDLKQYESMHVVQPGLYFVDESAKTRGVPETVVQKYRRQIVESFDGSPYCGVRVPLRSFIGLRLGNARGAHETIGEWIPVEKTVGYDWTTKRRGDPRHLNRTDAYGTVRTTPYPGSVDEWSIPYDRTIGGMTDDRMVDADMPDWGIHLV